MKCQICSKYTVIIIIIANVSFVIYISNANEISHQPLHYKIACQQCARNNKRCFGPEMKWIVWRLMTPTITVHYTFASFVHTSALPRYSLANIVFKLSKSRSACPLKLFRFINLTSSFWKCDGFGSRVRVITLSSSRRMNILSSECQM